MDIVRQFEERVLSIRNKLEPGMIHGDFNEQNILVEEINGEWQIKAILDFGDSNYSCYLYELAIAMTYMMLLKKDISAGGHVIAGYSSVIRISTIELLKVFIKECFIMMDSILIYLNHISDLCLCEIMPIPCNRSSYFFAPSRESLYFNYSVCRLEFINRTLAAV